MDRDRLRETAEAVMAEHGLIDEGWHLRIGSACRKFGSCNYSRRRITISGTLAAINSDAEVMDTILHEVAHALCSPGVGHGLLWRHEFLRIGGNGSRLGSYRTPPKKFLGTCPGCKVTLRRNRRSTSACGRCCAEHNGGEWTEKFKWEWERVA